MSEKFICYVEKPGEWFKANKDYLEILQQKINQRLLEGEHLSREQILDLIYPKLSDKRRPSNNTLIGSEEDDEFPDEVINEDFGLRFDSVVNNDGTILIEFDCLPKEDSE